MAGNGVDVFSSSNAFPGGGGGGSGGFSASYGLGLFGDGSDGDATIVGTTTLTKETHYNNLTITSTGILKPNGHRIFVKGSLIIATGGSINDDGLDASGTAQGAALTQRNWLDASSTQGGVGRVTAGVGTAGGAQGSNVSPNALGLAPAGGTGGTGGVNAGGAGGSSNFMTLSRRWSSCAVQFSGRAGNASDSWKGGTGGGSGGADATGGTIINSGAGGSGGGIVWIAAYNVTNAGRISANGGNGSSAATTGTASAGGGGGGGGGLVCLITETNTGVGTVQAAGGNGGAGAGPSGAAGASGSVGSVVTLILT